MPEELGKRNRSLAVSGNKFLCLTYGGKNTYFWPLRTHSAAQGNASSTPGLNASASRGMSRLNNVILTEDGKDYLAWKTILWVALHALGEGTVSLKIKSDQDDITLELSEVLYVPESFYTGSEWQGGTL